MSDASITDYYADYFLPTVREVLDGTLADYGFAYEGNHRGVSAYWSRGNCFFRVGYLPETSPMYELLMGIGVSTGSPLQPKAAANSVGIWRLLPRDADCRVAEWRFDGPARLRAELRRAWEEVVVPYAVPMLDDPDRLVPLLAQQSEQLRAEEERLRHGERLRRARADFREGRFAQAIHEYDGLAPEQLTRADRKRIELAQKRQR